MTALDDIDLFAAIDQDIANKSDAAALASVRVGVEAFLDCVYKPRDIPGVFQKPSSTRLSPQSRR
jgi:hypothetical protein